MGVYTVIGEFPNLLEMEKIGSDMFIGSLRRRNRKGFGNPGKIGFQMRVVVLSGVW